MSQPLNLGDITVIPNNHPAGSEILLFKRNDGFVGRVLLPETGEKLQKRLLRSMKRILESQ